MKNQATTVVPEARSEVGVSQPNSEPIDFTPKSINVDFDVPLRKHLDKAAIDRGWEIYKKDVSKETV